jgi:DNA-directed RNA polymerase subunit N (RpoN/RPB10)
VLRRIGAVPESIKIQADEYLFTLAAVIMEAQILPEALTYYRLHDANSFQFTDRPDPQKLRHKQESLAELAKTLSQKLDELGIERKVCRTVVEYTQASADQLRLALDGGWPWETASTEWTLYRILHPDARLSHRLFKTLMLAGALVTTPRGFYRVQRALSQNGLYRRARERWLPVPEMQHISKRSGA